MKYLLMQLFLKIFKMIEADINLLLLIVSFNNKIIFIIIITKKNGANKDKTFI